MKTVVIKSRHVDELTGSGSISISLNQFNMFKTNKVEYIVVNEKTNKTVKNITFNDIKSKVYMYRFIDSNTKEIKHTPNKNAITGEITKSFMVCKF